MQGVRGAQLNRWRQELDLVFQELLLPLAPLLETSADTQQIQSKSLKQLITSLFHAICGLGFQVICPYGATDGILSEFWMLGYLGDKEESPSMITLTKIEGKRPVVAIVLLPTKATVYSAVESQSAHEFELKSSSIIQRLYFSESTVVKRNLDEGVFLRILNSGQPVNQKTAAYIQNIIAYHTGAVRSVERTSTHNLIDVAKNMADIYVHLKALWAWEIAAFDLIIHCCGYMVTTGDGILPIAYSPSMLRISGFIAKTNFEYDTLDYKQD